MGKGNFFDKLIRQRSEPENFKVFVSMCVHRSMDAGGWNSLLRFMLCPNPKVSLSQRRGEADIGRSRSIEATNFYLDTDADVLMFIDDDIVYDELDAVKLCRLAYEKKSVVGATYIIKKADRTSKITTRLWDGQEIYFAKKAPPEKVMFVSNGFMAIHREVFTDMIKNLPKDEIEMTHENNLLRNYPFFMPYASYLPNQYKIFLSEDWAFCDRVLRLGRDVWLDPSIRLKHAGRYEYELEDLTRVPKQQAECVHVYDWEEKTYADEVSQISPISVVA